MKKFFSTILLISAVLMLSSCIIYTNDDDYTPSVKKYNITCHNVSDTKITDWCIVKDGKRTYAKSGGCSPIPANVGTSTIYNVPEGNYILYVAFVEGPDVKNGDYIESKQIILSGKDYDVYVDQTWVDQYWN